MSPKSISEEHRSAAESRREESQQADEIATQLRAVANLSAVRYQPAARAKRALGWLVLLVVLLAPAQLFGGFGLWVSTLILIYAIGVVGLNLILGYAGQISLAQGAFMGIGAYTVALTQDTLSFWAALVLGAAVGFIIGLGLGLPSLRVRHHYLAFVTLAFQMLFVIVMLNEQEITGGALGVSNIARPSIGGLSLQEQPAFHVLVAMIFMGILLISYGVLNSQWGRALKGIRENEMRAATLGVNIRNYKLLAFAIGSSMASVAGGLLAPALSYTDPNAFTFLVSLEMLLMVIIGGSGRFEGPLLGAIIVLGLPEVLRFDETYFLVAFAIAGILLVIFMPKGAVGLVDYFFVRVLRRPAPRLSK